MSLTNLVSLHTCLTQLRSDKVTERKKQVDALRSMLTKKTVIQALDINTCKKRQLEDRPQNNEVRLVTWDTVFNGIKCYIDIETRKLGQIVSPLNAKADTVKRTCCMLFKLVVENPNPKVPRLKARTIVKEVLRIMDDRSLRQLLGSEFTTVFVRQVLQVHSLSGQLPSSVLIQLFETYTPLFAGAPVGWSKATLHELLRLLLERSKICTTKPKAVVEVFLKIFANIRRETPTNYHDGWLSALLTFCKKSSLSCRSYICELGENLLVPFLHFWRNRPSENTKVLLLEIFYIQVILHHPCGRLSVDNGAFVVGTLESWTTSLKELCETLLRDCDQVADRGTLSTGKDQVRPELICTLVEVCNVVFSAQYAAVAGNDAFISLTASACSSSAPHPKRRRLSLQFSSLLDPLRNWKSPHGILPWLQLVSALLLKYPKVIAYSELLSLVETLDAIDVSANLADLRPWVLRCWCAVVNAYLNIKSTGENEVSTPAIPCSKIFEATVRMAALNQCHEEAHTLLCEIIRHKLVTPKSDFHRLFQPGSNNRVSEYSLRTLGIYLTNYPLPTKPPDAFLTSTPISSSFNTCSSSETSGRHWFHLQLLQWMLSNTAYDSSDSNHNWEDQNCTEFLAELLVFLCVSHGNPSFLRLCSKDIYTGILPDAWSWTKVFQEDLLKSSFDLPLDSTPPEIPHSKPKKKIRTLQPLYDSLLSSIFFEAGKLRDNYQLVPSICISNHICLLFHIMEASLLQSITTGSDLQESRLGETIKYLLKKLTESLTGKQEKEIQEALKPLQSLTKFNTYAGSEIPVSVSIQNYIPSLVPEETFEFMLKILTNYCLDNPQSTQSKWSSGSNGITGSHSGNSKNSDDTMDFDDPFDIEENNNEDNLPDPFIAVQNDGVPKCSELHLIVLNFLCKIFFYTENVTPEKERLMQFLNCEDKELNDSHLQLVLAGLKTIASREPKFTLMSVGEILRKHETDVSGTLYTQCMEVLKLCLPSLIKPDSNNEELEAAEGLLSLLETFWNREKKEQNAPQVSWDLAILTSLFLQKCFSVESDDFSLAENGSTVRLLKELMSQLTSPDVKMQATVADVFALLVEELPPQHHEKIYLEWHTLVMDSKELNMERSSQNCSLLTSLFHLATVSGAIERKALFTFLQLTRKKGIPCSLIGKVFNQLSVKLGFPSSILMLQFHMFYLVDEWLNNEYPLSEFPFSVANCTSISQFYRENLLVVITLLFDRFDVTEIQNVSKTIGRDWASVLKEALPSIMSHLICWFAIPKDSTSDWLKKQKTAVDAHKWLEKHLLKEVVQKEMSDHLDEVVTSIFLLLCEDNNGSLLRLKHLNVKLPPPRPNSFSANIIIKAFQYLVQGKGDRSLFTILIENDHTLVNVMLSLRMHLSSATRVDEECRLVLVYQLLVEMLLPDLSRPHSHRDYVLRELLSIPITQLKRSSVNKGRTSVRGLYLHLLKTVIEGTVELCYEDVEYFLPEIVNCLLKILEEEAGLEPMVCHLFEFIFSKKNYLKETLKRLDPIPNILCLQHIHQEHQEIRGTSKTLEEAFEKFWLSYKFTKGKPRVESLEELLEEIQDRKYEVNKMVDSFQDSHLYSEDLENSPFHLLISYLIKLCSSGTYKVQQMAAKCLGEIGPVELGTPVLCPLDRLLDPTFSSGLKAEEVCNLALFKSIVDLVHHDRIEVVKASSMVLKNILKTKTGQKFISYCKSRDLRTLLKYLIPFSSRKKIEEPQGKRFELQTFSALVDSFQLWVPNGCSHKEWLETLVCTLIDAGCPENDIFPLLKPLCRVEVNFNELLLPFLIHTILLNDYDDKVQEILSNQVSNFFTKHCQLVRSCDSKKTTLKSLTGGSAENTVVRCQSSVQTMLNVIQHLRRQTSKEFGAPARECNDWLRVDYLDVAMAAQYCNQPFTVLCYLELWRDDSHRHKSESQSSDSSNSSQELPYLSVHHSPYRAGIIQEVLVTSYKQIGDKDGLHGCSMLFEDSRPLRDNLFELDNCWDRILQLHDSDAATQFTTSSGLAPLSDVGNILKALQKCGLNHILQGYLNGILRTTAEDQISSELLEFQYKCGWRLGQWNLVLPEKESSQGVHQSLFKSLVYLPDREFTSTNEELCIGREQIVSKIQRITSKEQATYNINSYLSELRLFSLVQSAMDFLRVTQSDQGGSLNDLLDRWSSLNKLPFPDFEFVEPSLCLQGILLLKLANSFPSAISAFNSSLEQLLSLARQQGHLQVADQTLQRLLSVQTESGEQNLRWTVEEARNRWTRGEKTSATQILKSLLKTLEKKQEESNENAVLFAETLMQLGKWQADSCFESPSAILTHYLERAVRILEPIHDLSHHSLWEGHLCVARYADLRLQEIRKHQQSQSFSLKKKCIQESMDKALKLREALLTKKDKSVERAIKTMELQSSIDESEIKELEKEATDMLLKSIHNYLRCLRGTEVHDLRAFRVVALWFQNTQNQEVSGIIEKELARLETYKFLPLIHQLAARMGTCDCAHFQKTLQRLILRLCRDHPYHSMPVILALCHADKDPCESGRGRSKRQEGNSQEVRKKTAQLLLTKLKTYPPVQEYVQQLEYLSLSYIELAYQGCPKGSRGGEIAEKSYLLKPKQYAKVPVITEEIKVDKTLKYNSLTYVLKFEKFFRFVGGINAPKRVTCVASDGRERSQLVKGQDDLRQDAVMQQVFGLVNRLLKNDSETLKRKLHIRTYKVVPLSSRSGVLQWCDGTVTFGEYLAGRDYQSGAHKMYNPKEMTAAQCRQLFHTNQKKQDKLSSYLELCRVFTPVFRYFFLEKFPEPAVWYERRLAYIRSVATGSIVGYILGLGDRHVQNILLDNRTAEIIHIDFGVAFEQGRILQTPETVPFRLTRDLVDGMGIAGVEGVFRRCCEKSLEVMKASQESLLTILEVLLYDPLYVWTISAQEAISHQRRHDRFSVDNSAAGSPAGQAQNYLQPMMPDMPTGTQEVNKLAERVLLRLREKLHGVEDSVALSVPGQVSLLIQQAMDPHNLCKLFVGWQPFL